MGYKIAITHTSEIKYPIFNEFVPVQVSKSPKAECDHTRGTIELNIFYLIQRVLVFDFIPHGQFRGCFIFGSNIMEIAVRLYQKLLNISTTVKYSVLNLSRVYSMHVASSVVQIIDQHVYFY